HSPYPAIGIDEDRKQRPGRDDPDLRCLADAEPQYEQRDQSEFRDRIGERDDEIPEVIPARGPAHEDAERHPDDERQAEAAEATERADCDIADKFPASEIVPGRDQDIA